MFPGAAGTSSWPRHRRIAHRSASILAVKRAAAGSVNSKTCCQRPSLSIVNGSVTGRTIDAFASVTLPWADWLPWFCTSTNTWHFAGSTLLRRAVKQVIARLPAAVPIRQHFYAALLARLTALLSQDASVISTVLNGDCSPGFAVLIPT